MGVDWKKRERGSWGYWLIKRYDLLLLQILVRTNRKPISGDANQESVKIKKTNLLHYYCQKNLNMGATKEEERKKTSRKDDTNASLYYILTSEDFKIIFALVQ